MLRNLMTRWRPRAALRWVTEIVDENASGNFIDVYLNIVYFMSFLKEIIALKHTYKNIKAYIAKKDCVGGRKEKSYLFSNRHDNSAAMALQCSKKSQFLFYTH